MHVDIHTSMSIEHEVPIRLHCCRDIRRPKMCVCVCACVRVNICILECALSLSLPPSFCHSPPLAIYIHI